VKTTVDVAAPLLARARSHARSTGRPLRALIEEGLELVLQTERGGKPYRLPDQSVGTPNDPNALDKLSCEELRDEIHSGR